MVLYSGGILFRAKLCSLYYSQFVVETRPGARVLATIPTLATIPMLIIKCPFLFIHTGNVNLHK